MRARAIFGVLAAAAIAHAAPAPVVGGQAGKPGQFPAVVGITVTPPTGPVTCSGALVAPDWVLTAAHCIDASGLGFASQDQVAAATQIQAGVIDTSDQGIAVGATAAIVNPLYDPLTFGLHDTGLIQLAAPITTIAPVSLSFDAALAPASLQVTTVGFGNDHLGMQYVVVHTSSACAPVGYDDTALLCFPQDPTMYGIGDGDSGGPSFAVIRGRLVEVGVTSFLGGTATSGQIAGVARIDASAAFIVQTIPALDCTQACPAALACEGATCLALACTQDSDCADRESCVDGGCAARSGTARGLGAACETSADCDTGDCFAASAAMRCVLPCDVGAADTCPAGVDCVAIDGLGDANAGLCEGQPAASGGCCDAGGSSASMLAGIAIVAGLRRRKRASM